MRTKMRAALANGDALYLRSAAAASLAVALIDLEIVLKVTPAVDPIDAGAVTCYTFLQHLVYCG